LNAALLCASRVAAALAKAQAKGLVQRDLKPGNITIGNACLHVARDCSITAVGAVEQPLPDGRGIRLAIIDVRSRRPQQMANRLKGTQAKPPVPVWYIISLLGLSPRGIWRS